MGNEIQLISDDDGLAVIGRATDVERFLVSEGLTSKDLDLPRRGATFSAGAATAQAASEIAANSGRWVKLTKESAQVVHKYGLMATKTPGIKHAMVGQPGSIKNWIQIEALVTSPTMLAGVAGLMAQVALQQAMDEILDYLETINEKVDDVLRAQKDAVLADMIGVDFVLEEAMTVREHLGRIDSVTWSKVQATSMAIARTQAYALRQLDALAEKMENTDTIGDLAEISEEAESTVQEWLAVLARCFQLQDATAVLELDRVLDASPDELDQHRLALKAARQDRLELIARSTERLLARMDEAADLANTKVLLNPIESPAVVDSSNDVAAAVVDFRGRLGIERAGESWEARQWVDAATEVKDKALDAGAEGVDAAKRFGGETLDRARSMKDKLSDKLAERGLGRREEDE